MRLPGGTLSGEQAGALADASRDLGDGHLELTSRANVQIRGLRDGVEGELSERLHDAGLLPSFTHERVRNILASVLSGRDGGFTDVRPLVNELDAALCADPELAGLPGRFLFALDDGRGDVIAQGVDVGLYGLEDGFALVLAGRDSGARVSGEGAVALMIEAARAFLRVRDGEWRLNELDDLGALGMGGPAERVAVPETVRRVPVGVLPQTDGRAAVSGLVPFGRLGPDALGELRTCGEIIVTPWRGLVIPDLTDVPDFHGLVTAPSSGWEGLTSCAGRPGCAKSLTDVRADAARAREAGAADGGPPVHWAGCERRCGRPADRHVAVVATPGGYEVRLGDEVRARSHDLIATAAAVATTRRST